MVSPREAGTNRLELLDPAGTLRCTFASGQLRAASGELIWSVSAGAGYPARATMARDRQVGDDLVDERGGLVASGVPGQGALPPIVLAEHAAVLDGACGATLAPARL